jgi:hypothetical protein
MASQHTTSPSLISIVTATLVALPLVILFEKLDGPAARLMTTLLGAAAKTALALLLSLVPAAWRALEVSAFDHQWFSPCPLQLLASLWPLLHVIAGAA